MTHELSNQDQGREIRGIFSPEFRARVLNQVNEVMERLNNESEIRALARRRTSEIIEMIDELFKPADTYGFEQILQPITPEPISIDPVYLWNNLDRHMRTQILEEIGTMIGVDILAVTTHFQEENRKMYGNTPWTAWVPTNRAVIELQIEKDNEGKVWYGFRRAEEAVVIDEEQLPLN